MLQNNLPDLPVKYVKIEDTIRSFKEILEGKHDNLPEQAFMYVGTIEEAVEKAKSMQCPLISRRLLNQNERNFC